ncbi:MAG: hypothetical protein MZW92_40950 [Comamonadaceae bacterium]|nr:hypothetical protein [Comamonadaceae bacterium]
MSLSRRSFLTAGASFGAAWAAGPLVGCAAGAPKATPVAPGVTRVSLGSGHRHHRERRLLRPPAGRQLRAQCAARGGAGRAARGGSAHRPGGRAVQPGDRGFRRAARAVRRRQRRVRRRHRRQAAGEPARRGLPGRPTSTPC